MAADIDASIHITSFGPYKLCEFLGRNKNTGGGREIRETPGKNGSVDRYALDTPLQCGLAHCVNIYIYMFLAYAFIQSDLHCIQAIHFLSVCVFPGN